MRVCSYIADNCVIRREKLRFLSAVGGVASFRGINRISWHFEFTTLLEADPGDLEVRWRLTAEIVDSNPAEGMDVVVWCVGICLCDGLITRWQESYGVCVCVCVCLIVSDLEIWTMRRLMPELRSFPTEISTLPRNVRNLFAGDQLQYLLNTEILWGCQTLKAIVEIYVYQVLYINNYSVLRTLKETLRET